MEPIIRNMPIPCRQCRASVIGREQQVRRLDGNIVMECVWVCPKCGMTNKRGITKIISTNENK